MAKQQFKYNKPNAQQRQRNKTQKTLKRATKIEIKNCSLTTRLPFRNSQQQLTAMTASSGMFGPLALVCVKVKSNEMKWNGMAWHGMAWRSKAWGVDHCGPAKD